MEAHGSLDWKAPGSWVRVVIQQIRSSSDQLSCPVGCGERRLLVTCALREDLDLRCLGGFVLGVLLLPTFGFPSCKEEPIILCLLERCVGE